MIKITWKSELVYRLVCGVFIAERRVRFPYSESDIFFFNFLNINLFFFLFYYNELFMIKIFFFKLTQND
jgi:hypothetical protein